MILGNEFKSSKDDIIEEIDEHGKRFKIKASDLMEMMNSIHKNDGGFGKKLDLDYETFGKNYNIPKIICQKIKVIYYNIYIEIYYDNTKLLPIPIVVDFLNKDGHSEVVYNIYNANNINKIIKTKNFANPVIIKNKTEYPISSLNKILNDLSNELKIEDKNVIDYKSIFLNKDKQSNEPKLNFKIGLDLTINFKYYFKYPKPEDEFIFVPSLERNRIFWSNPESKMIGLCGPMGIGKSTTLLALLKLKNNYCYFNIKALKEYEDNFLTRKNQILLTKVAYALRNN